jgi:hypothetical protein
MKIHSSVLELLRGQKQTGGHSYYIQQTLRRKANASKAVENCRLLSVRVYTSYKTSLTSDILGQYSQ